MIRIVTVVVAIAATFISFGCQPIDHEGAHSALRGGGVDDLPVPEVIITMKDWIIVQKAMTNTWREHIESLKKIEEIYRKAELQKNNSADQPERIDLHGGFGLVQNNSEVLSQQEINTLRAQQINNNGLELEQQIAYESARVRNQGERMQQYSLMLNANGGYAQQMANIRQSYMKLGNLSAENYLSNQRKSIENGGLAIDNDGARIENFGKMLENQSKALENQLKALEVVLKGYYTRAYSKYVQAYSEYSDQIQKIWRKVGRVSGEVGGAMVQLRKYKRQASVCEARRKRVARLNMRAANSELKRVISLSQIPKILRTFSSTVEGEACLHKVLLTQKYRDLSELNRIEFELSYRDRPVGLFCPKASAADVEGLGMEAYPPVALNPETYEVTGYFQPQTYYQVFRLINDHDIDVKISRPPTVVSEDMCNRRHPEMQGFRVQSQEIEHALAETYEIQLSKAPAPAQGFSALPSGIPATNHSYRLFLERILNVVRRTQQCVNNQAQLADALGETETSTPIATGGPLEAGKPATSDYNIYMDENFPLMSATVRECMNMAEHHRYRAFAQLEATGAMLDILERATKMSPPRSPHPVQFQPVNSPQNRAGNDF